MNREDFLSHKKNKTSFIQKLSEKLIQDGQEVILAETDADTYIVKLAIEVIKNKSKIISLINIFFR